MTGKTSENGKNWNLIHIYYVTLQKIHWPKWNID